MSRTSQKWCSISRIQIATVVWLIQVWIAFGVQVGLVCNVDIVQSVYMSTAKNGSTWFYAINSFRMIGTLDEKRLFVNVFQTEYKCVRVRFTLIFLRPESFCIATEYAWIVSCLNYSQYVWFAIAFEMKIICWEAINTRSINKFPFRFSWKLRKLIRLFFCWWLRMADWLNIKSII